MDKIRLKKWNDSDAERCGWGGGLQEMGDDLGYTVDDLESYWWLDDEYDELHDGTLSDRATIAQITGSVLIHNRIYSTAVPAVVLKQVDNEIIALVDDRGAFF